MATVSVAMPVRNAAPTVEAAVASLQAQDLGDFEIVVVDHASSDDSLARLEGLARGDSRIRVLRCEGSYVDACNLAWRSCEGDCIARMDADDFAAPERLRRQRDFLLDHPDALACGTQVRIRKRNGEGDLTEPDGGYRRYETWINSLLTPEAIARERFVDSPLPHPSMMIRREALEEAGGYHDPPWAEDYDLWLRLLEAGHEIGKVGECLLDWIDAPGRSSRTVERYALGRFREAKAHYLARLRPIREGGAVVCGAGPTGKELAKGLVRRGIAVLAFLEVNPRQIGQRIGGIPVLSADEAGRFLGKTTLLAAVGSEPGRSRLKSLLDGAGFSEGRDFFRVA